MKVFIIVIYLVLNAVFTYSQTVCEKLKQRKSQIYGFKPSTLSNKQKEKKSKELDGFWRLAEENKSEAIGCLNDMILTENNDSFFCFDAASLLLKLDESETNLSTARIGIEKCALEDLQLGQYLRISYLLGSKGQDISTLIEKLISIPGAKIFLSNHFLTLNARDASFFLYNTLDTEVAERSLIKSALHGNETAKRNAISVLNMLSTSKGDSLISSLIQSKSLPDSTLKLINRQKEVFLTKNDCKGKISRTKILEHLKDSPYNFEKEFYGFAGNEELICSACEMLTLDDVESIRAARKKSISGLSDEALYEYMALTKILMTVRNK